MKAIITGGAGFLGARLARAVLDKGTLKDGMGQDQPVTESSLSILDNVASKGLAKAAICVSAAMTTARNHSITRLSR